MYCGSCIRDNALAAALRAAGHDVVLLPLYTPTRTDERNVSQGHVVFGGISVYLEQKLPLFRHTPAFLDRNPDTVARLRATLADTPPEGYAGCCDAIAGMDLLDAIESVEAPTLVIAGRQDPATPPPHAERIAERIPGARLEVVDAAHLANIELADEVTALTLSHLEGR